MALKLILTRHAKSTWDDPLLGDIERPLNERGRRAADAIGQWMSSNEHHADKALVSSAVRTKETWDLIKRHFSNAVSEYSQSLYLAGPDLLLSAVKRQKEPNILIICHNPGIAQFAFQLLAKAPDHNKFIRYPTGATTIVGFNADTWGEINWGQGKCIDFVVPKDL